MIAILFIVTYRTISGEICIEAKREMPGVLIKGGGINAFRNLITVDIAFFGLHRLSQLLTVGFIPFFYDKGLIAGQNG